MILRGLYLLTVGAYSNYYTLVGKSPDNKLLHFRRVRTPKSKIDGARLPENIHINYLGSPISQPT